ncbi:hypothetical protein EJ04DRAFT_514379 [Polyplosphaeria fusca]|uniref:Uncharacterized protein n=1 Tax=Polyplosphaeria fusca TaxID=682080 RepID=A0A9P4QSM3_9PLEO|nr:hypothetical protein EJ04DRAFT_514379 [Polyplosphaeria fusca]
MLRKSRKKESFLDAMKDLLDGMEVDLANLVKGVYPGKVISSKYAGPDVKQIEDDSTPTASPTKADISRSNHIKRSPIRRAPHVSISSTRQNLRSSSTRPQPAMVEMVAEIDNLLPPPLSNDPPESSKESNGKGVRSRRQLSRVTSTVQDWPNRNN